MTKQHVRGLGAIAVLAGSLLATAIPIPASAAPPEPSDSTRAPAPPVREYRMHAPRAELLTPEEHEQFRRRLSEAKTPEERDAVRHDLRELERQRAREKGLPPPRVGRSGRGPMEQLLTQEERDAFRLRLQNAQTARERASVRREVRGLIDRRAHEKGLAPPPPGPAASP